MFRLPRRPFAVAAALGAGLLALSGFACYRHHTPTEFVACPDLSGGWEEVADSSCLGTRRASLSLRQTGCTVFASSSGLQADVTLALDDRNSAKVQLNFFGCTGTVNGSATIFNGHEVTGQFEGTTSGPQSNCCGHVRGTFRWLR